MNESLPNTWNFQHLHLVGMSKPTKWFSSAGRRYKFYSQSFAINAKTNYNRNNKTISTWWILCTVLINKGHCIMGIFVYCCFCRTYRELFFFLACQTDWIVCICLNVSYTILFIIIKMWKCKTTIFRGEEWKQKKKNSILQCLS